jgi:fructose-1,6-bisphosphatase
MHFGRTTLSKFLIEQLRGAEDGSRLAALLVDVAAAVKAISAMTAKGALGADWEALDTDTAPGDVRLSLQRMAGDAVLRYCEWGGLLAGMASDDLKQPYAIPSGYERGPFLLLFDALHSASGLEVNSVLGSLFSVFRHRGTGEPCATDFLQHGRAQLAAGYALYGPATMLVLSVGRGTHGFTLERETGNFLLTHPDMRVPAQADEVAVNAGNERYWEPPVARYVRECREGGAGVRGRDFRMRWITSTVAQLHRVLIRGGVLLYPRDGKQPGRAGRLRLMFEVNPAAYLVEQAGGCASTAREPVLDIEPEALHQRVPVILGSREELDRIERYHRDYDNGTDKPYADPLFNERSLFRPAAGQ